MGQQNLGGALYTLSVDINNLLAGFAAAQQAAVTSNQNITNQVAQLTQNINNQINRLAPTFKLNLTVDTKAATTAVADLQKEIGRLKNNQSLSITLQGDQAQATLARLRQSITAAEKRGARIEVKIDAEKAKKELGLLQRLTNSDAFRFAAVAGGASALGAGALVVGATAINNAMNAIVESTKRAQDAQFALNAVYKDSAKVFDEFAEAQGNALKLNTDGFREAAVGAATLRNNYGFTTEQIKILIARSADLAAINGVDVPDAAKRASDAMRGEVETVERLGVSLQQGALKQFAAMTDEQRKNINVLDNVTAGQIRFNEFLRQTNYAQGEALKRSKESAGAFDALGASSNALAKELGGVLKPALDGIAGAATSVVDKIREAIKANGEFSDLDPTKLIARRFGATPSEANTIAKPIFDPQDRESARAKERQERQAQQDEIELNRRKRLIKEQQDAVREAVDLEIRELDRRQEYLERARTAELDSLEKRKKAALQEIADEKEAALDANKAQIQAAEFAKDAAIKAADERHRTIVTQLEREGELLKSTRQEEDRLTDDARRQQDRDISDRRREVDQQFDEEKTNVIRSIKEQEDTRHESIEHEIRDITRRTELAVRGLEEEADKARDGAARQIRAIEDQQDTEDDRHREKMDHLDAEEQKQLSSIDKQLRAIDDAARKASELERDAQLAADRSLANRRLAAAQRVGDPTLINAARKALAEANAAASKELVSRAQDAEKRRLQDQANNIRKEFDTKKRAIEAESRLRKDAADKEKQQIKDNLDLTLDAIGKRKLAAQDAAKNDIDRLRDQDEREKNAYEQNLQRIQDEFDAKKRATDDFRLIEDRALEDSRREQDTQLLLKRQAEDRDLELRKEAADQALREEKARIDDRYNGPDGELTKLHAATDEINKDFAARALATQAHYDNQKEIINGVYTNVDGTGLLDRIKQAKDDLRQSLEDQVRDWQKWSLDTKAEIDSAQAKLDEFIKSINKIGTITPQIETPEGTTVEQPRGTGGGQALPTRSGGSQAYGPVVKNASADSYWTKDGTHGGYPAADIFAPAGSPIYSPVNGTLDSYHVPLGGNAATLIGDDGRAYYFAHGKVPFQSGPVKRGEQIGQVGNTGNAEGTAAHLHFAISQHGPGVFSDRNGSGDVFGDSSYWGEGGTGLGQGDGDWIDITILGRKFRIQVADSRVPGDVGNSIRAALKAATLPSSWEFHMGLIAAAESGERNKDGSVNIGTGDYKAVGAAGPFGDIPKGLMQVIDPTFQRNREPSLPNDIFDKIANPAAAGNYIKVRYQAPWNTEYFDTGRMDWRGVGGYANGGWIAQRSLLLGLETGSIARVGEGGRRERIVPESQWDAGSNTQLGGGVPIVLQTVLNGRVIAEAIVPDLQDIETQNRILRIN